MKKKITLQGLKPLLARLQMVLSAGCSGKWRLLILQQPAYDYLSQNKVLQISLPPPISLKYGDVVCMYEEWCRVECKERRDDE